MRAKNQPTPSEKAAPKIAAMAMPAFAPVDNPVDDVVSSRVEAALLAPPLASEAVAANVAVVEVDNVAEEIAAGVAVVLELLDVVSVDAARKNPGLEICSEVLK